MACYLVTGNLGSGKTLASVGRIRDAMMSGLRVATNLDLNLDKLLPASSRQSAYRLPDKPTEADFEAMGEGSDSPDESTFGIIVLDELGSWLNARAFADKSRAGVLEWLIHSRKHGWHVYFIAQHLDQVDKQLRVALAEHLVICRRLDRLRIPLIGALIQALTGYRLAGPRVHIATVWYGQGLGAFKVDRWYYRARELYAAYNTRQIFREGGCGAHSMLSAWHLRGRYLGEPVTWGFWASCVWRVPLYFMTVVFVRVGLPSRLAFPGRAVAAQRSQRD